MKQKDVALIMIVVGVSSIVAFAFSAVVFSAKTRVSSVEVADQITSTFQQPDTKYFNANSINPTQSITIGGSGNTTPFSGTGN